MNIALTQRAPRLRLSLFPLEEMVAESIEFLRENEPPEGYFVGFSGGKDSIVTKKLCEMANVRHKAFYSATGIDAPEVVRFIRKEYPHIPFLHPNMTFWEGIRKKSPPLRMMRWCCDVLKKDPSRHIPLKHRVMGIRAEESARRAKRPRIDAYNGQILYKPIFQWTEWHVWDFIDTFELPYPSLYEEGFNRIGCVVCPWIMGGNGKRLQLHQERWPQYYRLFEKAVTDWFMSYRTQPRPQQQQTPEAYIQAYYRGGALL